ncbi:flavin monoamine oxidase family protein [Nocardia sp. NPDC057663]|uniref:flavin monoamine oxidase family protein n=1 Tax=Nocardia sp. NPDC057663 TaxID=3346201 RepID=UPI00367301AC
MEETTVVIVGAGFAGLTAARVLRSRGVDVLMLESANRVGGRAFTVRSNAGSPVDLGGQWIGHDHARVTALAAEFGMSLFRTASPGTPLVVDGGRRIGSAPLTMLSTGLALLRLEVLSRLPFRTRSDRVTVAGWVARIPGSRTRRFLDVILSEALACDLDQVSVGALMTGLRSAGGLRVMLGTAGGAQESLISGGAGGLADALATELGPLVQLNRPATTMTRTADGVLVGTPSGPVRAIRAIVTAPPLIAAAIRHEPPLPAERLLVQTGTVMGTIYKAVAVYDTPFWRENGYSGEVLDLSGPVPVAFDISPADGPGHLCVLVPGRSARALDRLSAEDRRNTVLGSLADHFGARTMNPLSWHEKSWHHDPHVGGGYSALPMPGALHALAHAGRPTGPIHWAGTETAPRWTGYLEGAVRSGERAAGEILAEIGTPRDREPQPEVG